jgi:hypothetical protein
MLKDEQVTPLLDAISTLEAYDLTGLPKVIQMALGAIIEQAEAVDNFLGQTLCVAIHDHDHGTDVLPVIVPEGVTMTRADGIAMLDDWEPDKCETVNIRPYQDNMVDDYKTAEQRKQEISGVDELDDDPVFAGYDNGPS